MPIEKFVQDLDTELDGLRRIVAYDDKFNRGRGAKRDRKRIEELEAIRWRAVRRGIDAGGICTVPPEDCFKE